MLIVWRSVPVPPSPFHHPHHSTIPELNKTNRSTIPPSFHHSHHPTFPELNKNPPEGVSVGLSDDDNMFMWELLIVGPADTVRRRAGAMGWNPV